MAIPVSGAVFSPAYEDTPTSNKHQSADGQDQFGKGGRQSQ